jgi:hypothetical protein
LASSASEITPCWNRPVERCSSRSAFSNAICACFTATSARLRLSESGMILILAIFWSRFTGCPATT